MPLFYPTPTTFLERKRKSLQCPEKLKTIGKYFRKKKKKNRAFIFLTCRFPAARLHRVFFFSRSWAWLWCFGLSNKQCHAYTVNSAASALSLSLSPFYHPHPSKRRKRNNTTLDTGLTFCLCSPSDLLPPSKASKYSFFLLFMWCLCLV